MTEYIWDRGIGTGARKTCKNCSWTLDVTQTWSPPSTVLVTDRCNIGRHKGQFGKFCLLLVRRWFCNCVISLTNYKLQYKGGGAWLLFDSSDNMGGVLFKTFNEGKGSG